MNLLQLVESHIRAGSEAQLPAVFAGIQDHGGPGFGLYWECLRTLFEGDKQDLIGRLHAATDEGHLLHAVSHYFLCGLAARDGDIATCKHHLGRSQAIMAAHAEQLAGDLETRHALKVIANQDRAIEPDLDFSAAAVAPGAKIEAGPPFADGAFDFFTLSSCNGKYFDRYAGDFFDALFAAVPDICCHVHLINPGDTSLKVRAEYLARHERLRITLEEGPDEASYYACRRLQVAAGLMRHHRRSVLISDIDVGLLPTIAAFDGAGAKMAAGIYKLPVPDPMLIMHLALSYYAYRPETLTFLDDLERYLEIKLPQGYIWPLDQCALLTVALLAERDSSFVFRDLAAVFGLPLDHFQINQDSSGAEKYGLRGYTPTQ